MEKFKHKMISAAVGTSCGLLPLYACYGNSCSSCYKCAGVGIGILMMILFGKLKIARSSLKQPRATKQ